MKENFLGEFVSNLIDYAFQIDNQMNQQIQKELILSLNSKESSDELKNLLKTIISNDNEIDERKLKKFIAFVLQKQCEKGVINKFLSVKLKNYFKKLELIPFLQTV